MRKALIVFLIPLILFSLISIMPVSASELLLVKKHYSAVWLFYDDHVEVVVGNEKIVLESILASSRLSRLFNFNFTYNGTHVVYTYSLTVRIVLKTYTLTVRNVFIFAETPYVKLKTIVKSNIRLPSIAGRLFAYKMFIRL